MSEAVLAAASGARFGVFQAVNVRAMRGGGDPFATMFVQVTIATVILTAVMLGSGELGAALVACLAVYTVERAKLTCNAVAGSGAFFNLLAGVLVALATWWRWAALEEVTVGAVLALSLLSVPIVLFLAPVIAGRQVERVTLGLWAGSGLVVAGALILVVA